MQAVCVERLATLLGNLDLDVVLNSVVLRAQLCQLQWRALRVRRQVLQQDTRLLLGLLHVHGSSDTRMQIVCNQVVFSTS